jgi:hypothetical protein
MSTTALGGEPYDGKLSRTVRERDNLYSKINILFHFIIIKKLTLKELLEVLGIEVEGLDIELDDINLDNIDQIIALIKKLLGLDLNYLTL